jgi:uncharacterized protein YcfL
MKTIFAILIISLLMITGCGSSQAEKETPVPQKEKAERVSSGYEVIIIKHDKQNLK